MVVKLLWSRTCWSPSLPCSTAPCRRNWPGHSESTTSMATVRRWLLITPCHTWHSKSWRICNRVIVLGVITKNEMGNVVVAVYELMGIIIKHPPVNAINSKSLLYKISKSKRFSHGISVSLINHSTSIPKVSFLSLASIWILKYERILIYHVENQKYSGKRNNVIVGTYTGSWCLFW